MRILLASASPRRRELLGRAGVSFEIEPADVDEKTEETDPVFVARMLAERKARKIASLHSGEEDLLVLGADTVVGVSLDGGQRLLGKPVGEEEARFMLRTLSGVAQDVVTGICCIRCGDQRMEIDHERTRVHMRPITQPEIDAYVESGEWRGKAGGYAIQETADRFVTHLEEGSFENVVGLPIERTKELLRRLGALL